MSGPFQRRDRAGAPGRPDSMESQVSIRSKNQISSAFAKNQRRRAEGLCTGCGKNPCECENPSSMRQAKELLRVQGAIRTRDRDELAWAVEYCNGAFRRAKAGDKKQSRNIRERAEALLLKLRSTGG